MEYSHWVLRKSNAKSMDIDMETNLLSFQSKKKKEFKKRWIWDVFPSASVLLLFRFSIQSMAQFKKAKEMLEMGLDYLVDDNALTINFNIQLGEACHGLGDEKKRFLFF
jgi:hypothetical protein